jgi:hypothetical protein
MKNVRGGFVFLMAFVRSMRPATVIVKKRYFQGRS